MKTTILYSGLASPHVGWAAVDELAPLLAYYFNAELLSPGKLAGNWLQRRLHPHRQLYKTVPAGGGDVLIVVARGPGDLRLINAIPDCRKQFKKIYGVVIDSYFQEGYGEETALYDAITVTAHDDVTYPRDKYGIQVHQLYQGADCLTWAPKQWHSRDIDLIGFGRTPTSYQACFAEHFHQAKSPFLYLHSPLGNITGDTVHLERGMLFKLLHRSKLSLAFHMFVELQGERPRSMSVTSRWLESLLSGCIVVGRRPPSRMAEDMLFWPGCTIELPEDPKLAAQEVEQLLERNHQFDAQRQSNIAHMIGHHDWRYRIRDFCGFVGLPTPDMLDQDVQRLQALGVAVPPCSPDRLTP